jgi:phosphopantothenoylcysteine decarboxylase/phosphopantothenate--cysteine ligase
MAEPHEIVTYVTSLLHTRGKRDLIGKRVLISGGGTREFLDPVRFIGNPATGKMGLALASAAVARGGDVTLIYGSKPGLPDLGHFNTIGVTTAAEMASAMIDRFNDADIIMMAAAVGDVKPATYSPHKLPKQDLADRLPLIPVQDIVASLGERKQPHQILIGFAAQTGDIITPALEKLQRKKLDGIVANPIDLPDSGFGSDRNQAVFINSYQQQFPIPHCSKLIMSHHIFDLIMKSL